MFAKNFSRTLTLLTALALCLALLISCGEQTESETETAIGTEQGILEQNGVFSVFDQTADVPAEDVVTILLNNGETTVENDAIGAVTVVGQTVTITQSGTYRISGTLSDGQLRVNAPDSAKVRLWWNGVSITNYSTAPVWIQNADKVVITLAEGSTNTLTDTADYVFVGAETKPNACLYAADDLTINGSGALTVSGAYNNGIGCKNDLRIVSGTLTVTAANNALKGNDSVAILNGTMTLTAGGDGIKADTEDDPAKGYVQIRGGAITITAVDEGIQAFTSLSLEGGTVTVASNGDAVKSDGQLSVADGVLIEK